MWTFKTWIFQVTSVLWGGEVSASLEPWYRKRYLSRQIRLRLQTETTAKSQWLYPAKVYFSLILHVRWGQPRVLLIIVTQSWCILIWCILHLEIYFRNHQDRKREDWNTEAADKCFCPEVIHVSFAHICLAKGRHLATHNLNVVEKCKLRCIYSRRMKIFNSSMTRTLMTTIEGHALDGGCKWNCSWGMDNKSYRELSS